MPIQLAERLGEGTVETGVFGGKSDTLREFVHPYFEYTVTCRKAVRQQVILLRKAITEELDKYHALTFTK